MDRQGRGGPRRPGGPGGPRRPASPGKPGAPNRGGRPGGPGGSGPAKPGEARRSFDKKPLKEGDRRPESPAPRRGGIDARRLALNALGEVVRVKAYSTLALSEHLRAASHLTPEDKRLATVIFYAALENRIQIAWILKQFVQSMPEKVIEDILHIAAAQILFLDRVPDHAAVNEAVGQVKSLGRERFAPLVNGALRSLIRARDAGELHYPEREDDPIKYLSVMNSLPLVLATKLIEDYGLEEAERMAAYRPGERTQVIRPNLLRYTDKAFASYLDARRLPHERGTVPHAFHLTGAGDLGHDPDYKNGVFSIQGEGSMLAALAVAPERGQNILDACAAPGGKSALICELMGLTGRVQAWEVHEHRVELLRATKDRLRLDNLRAMARDSSIHRPDCDTAFDSVLIDAPCSGLGVMINKPDIKYRVTEDDIQSLTALQARILEACAGYPRVGGRLVYATCTVLKDENERQVRAFLDRHGEYALDPSDDWLPEALRPRLEGGMLQLQAHIDGMEGFFIARMTRKRL